MVSTIYPPGIYGGKKTHPTQTTLVHVRTSGNQKASIRVYQGIKLTHHRWEAKGRTRAGVGFDTASSSCIRCTGEKVALMMSTESTRFVWLPSSRVWAYVPSSSQAPVEMEDRAKRKRRSVATVEGSISSQAAGIGELGLAPGFTSLPQQQQREKQSRLGLESSSSQQATCAICLGAIEREKGAVLRFCMHEFCTHCIEEWSRVRRVCPLCKADFSGWYQGTRLEERILPPATLAQQQSLPRSSTPVHSSSRLPFWRLHSQR
jgi:hypothetical protein